MSAAPVSAADIVAKNKSRGDNVMVICFMVSVLMIEHRSLGAWN